MPLSKEKENELVRHLVIYLHNDTTIGTITEIVTFVNKLIDEK